VNIFTMRVSGINIWYIFRDQFDFMWKKIISWLLSFFCANIYLEISRINIWYMFRDQFVFIYKNPYVDPYQHLVEIFTLTVSGIILAVLLKMSTSLSGNIGCKIMKGQIHWEHKHTIIHCRMGLKIPNGLSECIYRRRTYNTMAKRKKDKQRSTNHYT
jgi:hypothetical protein